MLGTISNPIEIWYHF